MEAIRFSAIHYLD